MSTTTFEEIRKKAKKQTDEEFAAQISSLIRLTDAEIKELAPNPPDREKLAHLLAVVKNATKSNEEKAEAIKTVEGLAEIAISLLGKLL